MVKIKPFSGLYYYNKYSKANNISKFVKQDLNFDYDSLALSFKSDLNVAYLQNFNNPSEVNSNLKNWLESGVLTVAGGAAFYVCEMAYKIFDRIYSVRGLFAAMDLPENDSFAVEKFDVASKNGTDLVLNLLRKVNFQTSSVFALYDDNNLEISSILKNVCEGACFERAKHSNVSYKVWEVTDKNAVEELQSKFEKVEKIYLAGGFEVFDAAIMNKNKNNSANCVLTFFVDKSSDAIAVLPFHRVVSMSMFDLGAALKNVSSCFKFAKCSSLISMRNKMFALNCEGRRAFGVYAEESFGVLELLKGSDFEAEFEGKSDSYVVDSSILKLLCNSDDFCVQFTSSARTAKAAVDNGDGCVAVFLNSPRLSELAEFASCGSAQIKKAAYIFPRPVDGLIFYSVES